MTDPILTDAIEALEGAAMELGVPLMDAEKRLLVDAVLAAAGPAYRAEALREAARSQGPYPFSNWKQWLRDRADEEEGS